jgi:hypothetical protein
MRSMVKSRSPRRCTRAELRRVGVEVVPVPGYWLSCVTCRYCWSPMIRPGGRNPKGYWKCPAGCNHP